MGNTTAAVHSYEKVLEREPQNRTAKDELVVAQAVQRFEQSVDKDFDKGDYRRVRYV